MSDSESETTDIIWKPIPGWSKYLASNTGMIKNFWTDKILKFQTNNGYYSVCLSGDGDQITYLVHRLIAITFHANTGNLLLINYPYHVNLGRAPFRSDHSRLAISAHSRSVFP